MTKGWVRVKKKISLEKCYTLGVDGLYFKKDNSHLSIRYLSNFNKHICTVLIRKRKQPTIKLYKLEYIGKDIIMRNHGYSCPSLYKW